MPLIHLARKIGRDAAIRAYTRARAAAGLRSELIDRAELRRTYPLLDVRATRVHELCGRAADS